MRAAPGRQGALRPGPAAPWRAWGGDPDPVAVGQMDAACRLPVAVRGALMPDAHPGYGLPIGGVLAADNAVIPYAVGVDIGCRMMLTVTDAPPGELQRNPAEWIRVLESATRFGRGASFETPHDHPVLHRDWSFCDPVRRVRDLARGQLGTSGSGNHFVEYGILTLAAPLPGLPPGPFLSILSHGGSRGPGALLAERYCKEARARHPELPRPLQPLGWLAMDSDGGREYWRAMELMGEYSAANHEIIHEKLVRGLGVRVLARIQNHHNFAWRERHGGRDLIVHRKGATPAARGALGMIPGSMTRPGFLVRGLGEAASLSSAAHGAGRRMSRGEARRRFDGAAVRRELEAAGVILLSAGRDEAPGAYKEIDRVMGEQADLVEVVARFDPKIVKMAPEGR